MAAREPAKRIRVLIAIVPALLAAGCSQTLPDRAERLTRGCIYYLDGAGGGNVLRNWSSGLKEGMLDAGYDGAGEMFKWQTGLGMLADQRSSVAYKKSKAEELSRRIQNYSREYPSAPVTLIGLSAGTAVAVFTLEALPLDNPVDNVVLLSGSLSADYDLTPGLQRVRGYVYVSTSDKDAMLAYMVPLAGTADRRPGSVPSSGLRGFQLPVDATPQTREQYAKIIYIHWAPEFEQLGHKGQHFDTVSRRFVQAYVAPLIMRGPVRRTSAPVATGERVQNPDYVRWSRVPSGSWVVFTGSETIEGIEESVRVKATLISKQPDMLVVERQYFLASDRSQKPIRVHGFFVPARIDPLDHPFISPEAKISEMPSETVNVAGEILKCRVRSVRADGEFPEYGRDVSATVSENEIIPGGLVRIRLKATKGDQRYEFVGVSTDYHISSKAAGD